MSPLTMPWAGHEGHRKADALTITPYRKKINAPENPLIFYDRLLLCRLMVSGKSITHEYPFIEPRNELIYDYLIYLQKQEFNPDIESLVRYLRDCDALDQAGGEMYVRDIFRGIPDGALS
jgi:hypothetical protein